MVALLGLTAAFHAVFIARSSFRWHGRQYFVLFDDAMISMRFGRNLAQGHGLVWNVSGPPVEGYTNPAWTVWMAIVHLFGIPERYTSLAVMISASLLVLVTVVLVCRICEAIAPSNKVVAVTATVLIAAWYPLAYWSLRGMEVGAVACLVAWAILAALRYRDSAGRRGLYQLTAALLLLEAMRLDALVPAVLIAAWTVWQAPRVRRRFTAVVLGGSLIGLLAAMTIGRLLYYGAPLPNTYYLKATGYPLSQRLDVGSALLGWSLTMALFPLVAAAAFAWVRWWRTREPLVLLLTALCLAAAAYSVSVGGDAWETTNIVNRYLTPLAPALVVLVGLGLGELLVGGLRRRLVLSAAMLFTAAYGLHRFATEGGRPTAALESPGLAPFTARPVFEALAAGCLAAAALLLVSSATRLGDRPSRRAQRPVSRGPWIVAATVFAAATLVGSNLVTWTDWWRHNPPYLQADTGWAKEGLGIRASTRPGAMVALYAAGAIGYFDHRPAADAYGKVDPHIARERPDSDAVFRPGHDKTDLAWTVRRWDPDLFEQAPLGATPTMSRFLQTHGYVLTPNRFWVKAGDPLVDAAKLRREVPLPTFAR